jgi:pimeloyl-ACP methyl ester carboxylesterase
VLEQGRRSVGGLEIAVWEGGSGPDLLFLHPGTGLADHQPFLEQLGLTFHVVAPAHPGFEGSDNSKAFTALGDLAYHYLDVIDTLALDRPVIVGASLGAWLAAEIAARSTAACSRLILTGPLGAKFGGVQEREITDLFAYPIYEQDQFLFADPARAQRSYADADQQDLLTMARNFESFARLAWSPTLYNPKLRHRLARLRMPALVLRGQDDRVVSDAYCRRFAEALPDARYEMIESAGHYAHIEQPDRVCAAIAAFAAAIPA